MEVQTTGVRVRLPLNNNANQTLTIEISEEEIRFSLTQAVSGDGRCVVHPVRHDYQVRDLAQDIFGMDYVQP